MPPPTACKCADCGEPAYCYDHRDYRKPIDVQPVCRACNQRRGPGLPLPTAKDNAEHKKGIGWSSGKKWSGLDVGEGFEPLACHLNGITASDLEHIAAPMDLHQTLEQMSERDELSEAFIRNRTGRRRGANVARTEWFKKKDPWYA